MKADGIIVRCSRNENAELFSLALGGYGLFGVILDVDLQVVPNERYHSSSFSYQRTKLYPRSTALHRSNFQWLMRG